MRIDPAALAAFGFIRDDAGLLSPAERERAEEQLRDFAGRTGVFGVVITVGQHPRPGIEANQTDEGGKACSSDDGVLAAKDGKRHGADGEPGTADV